MTKQKFMSPPPVIDDRFTISGTLQKRHNSQGLDEDPLDSARPPTDGG